MAKPRNHPPLTDRSQSGHCLRCSAHLSAGARHLPHCPLRPRRERTCILTPDEIDRIERKVYGEKKLAGRRIPFRAPERGPR